MAGYDGRARRRPRGQRRKDDPMTDQPTGSTDPAPTTPTPTVDPATAQPMPPVSDPPSAADPVPTPITPPAYWPREEPRRWGPIVFGGILLVIGLWFFADQTLGLDMPQLRWSQLWPLFIIGVGVWIALGSMRRSR
jgi:hypothetical protein